MAKNDRFLLPSLVPAQEVMALITLTKKFGDIHEPNFLTHLLNRIDVRAYQLPLLQHCLMQRRIQDNTHGNNGQSVSSIGGNVAIQTTFSLEANEAFEELNEQQQAIAEWLFRCLSGHGQNGRDAHYPMKLKDIAIIAGVSESEVKEVVEVFRRPTRCFLLPSVEIPLESDTVLDLNQGSSIRYWKTLHTWIEKEAEAAAMYQQIEHTACLWKEGKTGLWADPELKIALQWQQQAKLVPEWAKRYGDHFPLAMEFLEANVQNQNNQHCQMERDYQRMVDLERKCQRLQADYAYQKEIEEQHELEIQNLRTSYRELELKHERHLKAKQQRWKKAMMKVVVGSVVFLMAIVVIGGKWTFDTTIRSQHEKQQTIAMASESQHALEKAELNSVTYKKMIAALFRFLSESDQNKTFFQWVKDTSAMETLLPGLRMMIETAENINAEEKSYWNDRLLTIDEGKQVELLKILSAAASGIVNVKDNFRISQVIVKNESGAIINPWEGTYLLKRGEKVLLDIAMRQSSGHNAKIEYSNIVKDSILSHATKTSSGLSMTYVASNVSGSRDLVLIKVLQTDTGKIMDQKIVTFKVIESSLKGADVPTN